MKCSVAEPNAAAHLHTLPPLHRSLDSGVPAGAYASCRPCGLCELEKFSILGSNIVGHDYMFHVSRDRALFWAKGSSGIEIHPGTRAQFGHPRLQVCQCTHATTRNKGTETHLHGFVPFGSSRHCTWIAVAVALQPWVRRKLILFVLPGKGAQGIATYLRDACSYRPWHRPILNSSCASSRRPPVVRNSLLAH